MKLIARIGVAATTVACLSFVAVPAAGAAEAADRSGKIRVCIEDLGRGEAKVNVGGYVKYIDSGECKTFSNLIRGRVYGVAADSRNRCDIRNDERRVRADRDPRRITFYGDCDRNDRRDNGDRDRRDRDRDRDRD
ncbi:MAG: hypothetical protein ACT4QF_23785 [Sporichthyaceae bacterium]